MASMACGSSVPLAGRWYETIVVFPFHCVKPTCSRAGPLGAVRRNVCSPASPGQALNGSAVSSFAPLRPSSVFMVTCEARSLSEPFDVGLRVTLNCSPGRAVKFRAPEPPHEYSALAQSTTARIFSPTRMSDRYPLANCGRRVHRLGPDSPAGARLSQRFKGARVRDVGQRRRALALALWKRGEEHLVCADMFAPTPVITVESGELPIGVEPGFVRSAGAALRGTTLAAVLSRRGDRLLRMEFGSRSPFGIEERLALVFELVPRFGNIVLLKNDTIVAAVKEFAPSENAVRSIQAGDTYNRRRLRPGKSSPLLSDEQLAQFADRVPDGDLHVYRRDGALVQAHVVPLPQFAELQHERVASLLGLLAEARETHAHAQQSDRVAKRRNALDRALTGREKNSARKLRRSKANCARAKSAKHCAKKAKRSTQRCTN